MNALTLGHSVPGTGRLVRFLLNRIEDDEADLRRASRAYAVTDPVGLDRVAHLRAECTAKRQVLGALQQMVIMRDLSCEGPVRDAAFGSLCVMAGVYSEHRDFDPAWALVAERRRIATASSTVDAAALDT